MSLEKEGKENTLSSHDQNDVLRTPVQQIKRTESMVRGTRRPLASKDNNSSQSVIGLTQKSSKKYPLKRPASSFGNNISGNKLKKYGSVLGMSGFMPRTKSLVLKDAEEEKEEDFDGCMTLRDGQELNVGLGGGLKALIQKRTDEMSLEYAPDRKEEIPHVPNGYEEFDLESIQKLKEFRSPFEVEKIEFSTDCVTEHTREPELIALSAPGSPIEKQALGSLSCNKKKEPSEDVEDISLVLSEEYNGHGLNSFDLNSLLD